jgi:hypothetical protein
MEKTTTLILMYPIIAGKILNMTYAGRLGGPKRAPGDGPPGVKTVWIGLIKPLSTS